MIRFYVFCNATHSAGIAQAFRHLHTFAQKLVAPDVKPPARRHFGPSINQIASLTQTQEYTCRSKRIVVGGTLERREKGSQRSYARCAGHG
jgi:hypothetical protein